MKPASYAVMLLHAHVRNAAPLPTTELNALKQGVSTLSAIGRNLNQLARAANSGDSFEPAIQISLQSVQRQVADLRKTVATLVRANLKSWEAGDA
jgi:hypothetical protein